MSGIPQLISIIIPVFNENETIIERIYKSKKRPLVSKLNKEEIINLIKKRSKVYELSDHKINC